MLIFAFLVAPTFKKNVLNVILASNDRNADLTKYSLDLSGVLCPMMQNNG